MSYPSLEQYNEALQAPQLALCDPELKRGAITTTGLGLPLALCGGFALTYTISTQAGKYAVRCFHKQSNALEQRYRSISSRLRTLNSPYFVDFEYQPHGVRVGGNLFPVVKMAWANGTTLGQFLEQNYRNASALQQLGMSLRTLAKFLETQRIAHGDVQPGNVMVANSGKAVQLIDYDGIFTEELRAFGSAELGHRNFQHPKRSASAWDASLDRFSFIGLDLALRALVVDPELWIKTQSDGDAVLFKANDLSDVGRSAIFADLRSRPQLREDAGNFVAICSASFDRTPTLEDFLARRNIPQIAITTTGSVGTAPAQYLSAFPVLDAGNYALCFGFVGDKVELIGRVVDVKQAKTRYGKPYVFLNFGPWKGSIVKISIWSDGLRALVSPPDKAWVGKWVSVVGLMEPPYESKKYGYSHLSISITQGSQIHTLSEGDAKFRLGGSSTRSASTRPVTRNRQVLEGLRSEGSSTNGYAPGQASVRVHAAQQQRSPASSNQAVLKKMKGIPPSGASRARPASSAGPYQRPQPQPAASSNSGCFIASAVYGSDAPETEALRLWRDRCLVPSRAGRALVAAYYKISPYLVPTILWFPSLHKATKRALDWLVRTVQ